MPTLLNREVSCLCQSDGGIVKPKVARYAQPGVKAQGNSDCREREDCPVHAEEYWAEIPTAGCGMQWVVVHCEAGVARSVDSSDSRMRDAEVLAGTSGFLFETQTIFVQPSRHPLTLLRKAVRGSYRAAIWQIP